MAMLKPSPEATKTASYTGTAGNTDAFPYGYSSVLVWATTDAYVSVGAGAVATSSDTPVPAFVPVVIEVPSQGGVEWRVSAIQIAAAGTVYAKPLR